MTDKVIADEETLTEWLFMKRAAEVIYIMPAFMELARIAAERKCGRIEWMCLDWNRPSIDFYLSLGAEALSEWTTYRLSGDALKKLAEVKVSGRS